MKTHTENKLILTGSLVGESGVKLEVSINCLTSSQAIQLAAQLVSRLSEIVAQKVREDAMKLQQKPIIGFEINKKFNQN